MTPVVDKNALWTPGNGLTVWIPDSARRTVYGCKVCGRGFPEEQKQQWSRHVIACAKRHEDEILEELHEKDNNILFSPMDKERHIFLRDNPRPKLKRRRMKGIAGS